MAGKTAQGENLPLYQGRSSLVHPAMKCARRPLRDVLSRRMRPPSCWDARAILDMALAEVARIMAA